MQWNKRAIYGTSAAAVLSLAAWGGTSWRHAALPPLAPVPAAVAAVEIPAGGEETPAPSLSPAKDAPSESATPAPPTRLLVHVAGAVNRPGVYTLKPGDRVLDAIRAAGGLKTNAQPDSVNQADFVQDADQIYLMTREEDAQQNRSGGTSTSTASLRRPPTAHRRRSPSRPRLPTLPRLPSIPSIPTGRVLGKRATTTSHRSSRSAHSSGHGKVKFKNPGDGTVNINTADAEELQKLPGVGPAMSTRIIEYRQQIGLFRDISQLQDVKGIGDKTFAKIQPFVRVE